MLWLLDTFGVIAILTPSPQIVYKFFGETLLTSMYTEGEIYFLSSREKTMFGKITYKSFEW